jgi:2-polyprenyl-3-methyl-5-hydroxy-6-metoxy-1,4-benzoquinol methylase
MSEEIHLQFKFILYSSALPIITVLVNNNIAEKLQESPKTAEELCESTSMQPDKLFRFLRLVSNVGLFINDPETNKWSNTKDSLLLTSPLSHAFWAWAGSQFNTEMLTHAESQLCSSRPPMETLNRPPLFEQIFQDKECLHVFQNWMTAYARSNSKEIVEAISFKEDAKVLDVGGADGTLVISLTQKFQNASFGVFDRPEVNGLAQANFERFGVTERVKFYGGNFFEEIQGGFDVIVMKNIIHDWNDEKCLIILKNCRKVLKEGDQLFVIDNLVDPNSEFYSTILALDHVMLMKFGGKERTTHEFKKLFDATGFEIIGIKPALFHVVIETKAI